MRIQNKELFDNTLYVEQSYISKNYGINQIIQNSTHENTNAKNLALPFTNNTTESWHHFFPGLEFKNHPENRSESLTKYQARKIGIEKEFCDYKYEIKENGQDITISGELIGKNDKFNILSWMLRFIQHGDNTKLIITANYKLNGNVITRSVQERMLFNPLIKHELNIVAHRLHRFQYDPQSFGIYNNSIETGEDNLSIKLTCDIDMEPEKILKVLQDKQQLEKILTGCEVENSLAFTKKFPMLRKSQVLHFQKPNKQNEFSLSWESERCLPLSSVHMFHEIISTYARRSQHQLTIKFNLAAPGAPNEAKQVFVDIFSIRAYTQMRGLIKIAEKTSSVSVYANKSPVSQQIAAPIGEDEISAQYSFMRI